ncbi:MAG: hypothetical protein GY757_51020 [bacterium]|nr:hypothetical protein [bacterium]
MKTYRLETKVTKDGQIILPGKFKKMFAHQVEIFIKDKTEYQTAQELDIPAYLCGGKVEETDFSREEIYDYRL